MTKCKYSILQTEQNRTQKYKPNKIKTWQNAKIPRYKHDKIQKDTMHIIKIQM